MIRLQVSTSEYHSQRQKPSTAASLTDEKPGIIGRKIIFERFVESWKEIFPAVMIVTVLYDLSQSVSPRYGRFDGLRSFVDANVFPRNVAWPPDGLQLFTTPAWKEGGGRERGRGGG